MSFLSSNTLAAAAAGLVLASTPTAQAADVLDAQQFEQRYSGNAVSALNFKIEGGYFAAEFGNGGEFSSTHGEFVEGAVAIPLAGAFGLQIDAGYLQSGLQGQAGFEDFDVSAAGIGGHAFWRNPSIGLLGVYGHHTEYDFDNGPGDRIKNIRFGIEGEVYLGNMTAKAFAGNDRLDWNYANNTEDFLVGRGEIDFYINDNFMVFAGVEHAFEQTSAKAGFETLFDTGSISSSIFAEGDLSEDGHSIMAGLRVYFGPQGKSLKARHREDDPQVDLFGNFAAIGGCMNKVLERASKMDLPDFGKISGIHPKGNMDIYTMANFDDPKLDGCSDKQKDIIPPLPAT